MKAAWLSRPIGAAILAAVVVASLHFSEAEAFATQLEHSQPAWLATALAISIVPGGLGTFEAMSILTLRAVGVDVPVALSATLLFRGFIGRPHHRAANGPPVVPH